MPSFPLCAERGSSQSLGQQPLLPLMPWPGAQGICRSGHQGHSCLHQCRKETSPPRTRLLSRSPRLAAENRILGKHLYFPDYIRQTTVHPDMLILSDHVGTGCALGRTLDGGSGEDACLIPGPLQKWRLLGPLQPLKWAVQVFVWTFVLDFLLF